MSNEKCPKINTTPGVEGIKLVQNTRDDDLFLLLDADEVPSIEPLLFLKLYDGYGEPIQWNFQWNVYRFYWSVARPTIIWVLCSLGFLKDKFENNAALLRGHSKNKQTGTEWKVGDKDFIILQEEVYFPILEINFSQPKKSIKQHGAELINFSFKLPIRSHNV